MLPVTTILPTSFSQEPLLIHTHTPRYLSAPVPAHAYETGRLRPSPPTALQGRRRPPILHYERKIDWARAHARSRAARTGGRGFHRPGAAEICSPTGCTRSRRPARSSICRGPHTARFALPGCTHSSATAAAARGSTAASRREPDPRQWRNRRDHHRPSGGPSRDLATDGGFLARHEAGAKVRAWFHQHDAIANATNAGAASPGGATPPRPSRRRAEGNAFPVRRKGPRGSRRSAVISEGVGRHAHDHGACCGGAARTDAGYVTLGVA